MAARFVTRVVRKVSRQSAAAAQPSPLSSVSCARAVLPQATHITRAARIQAFHTSSAQLTMGAFRIPRVENEPNHHYAKESQQRSGLKDAIKQLSNELPLEVPIVVGGKEITTDNKGTQYNPASHKDVVAKYSKASAKHVADAIESALAAKSKWEAMPFADRAAIFLKAADLVAFKYRYKLMAATMLGQGKNAWQAEIDSAAELADFFRFNVKFAEEMYANQPQHNSPGVWNRSEYRALEGFVYAVSPFNFTAIAGNLPGAPALLGNVVVWKPSDSAIASNWLVYQVLLEAGLPRDVIQFVPGDPVEVSDVVLKHKDFASLHFTGSTLVFRQLWGTIGKGVADGVYRGYPRVVGETGGKNFHLIHPSADLSNAVNNTVRGAFEYSGQKCSATSRCYVPQSMWSKFRDSLVKEIEALNVGDPLKNDTFIGPVIHKASFDKLKKAIDDAKADNSVEVVCGGKYDDSKGYFVHPTVLKVSDPSHTTMKTEFFGPILSVYVYDNTSSSGFDNIMKVVDECDYSLTGSIFATDRHAVTEAMSKLQNAAGNFYINCKSTGAVVGQQPFGGARASGTNDKAGSANLLSRFVSQRSIKEEFMPTSSVLYPSNH